MKQDRNKWWKRFVMDQDMFGHAIQLTFKNQTHLKTIPGGFCSIAVKIIVSLFTIAQLI
jgi:hypothetical protein